MRTSNEKHNAFYKRLAGGLFFLFFLFVSLSAHNAYAAEFELKKVDSHYEPVSYEHVVTLPGTDMKAGIFEFLIGVESYKGKTRDRLTSKAGVLVNNEVYYVESSMYEHVPYPDDALKYENNFDPGGDTNFGVYKDYFVMDSWSHGASHNRIMYLFRFSKDNKVELLDVLVQAHLGKGVPFSLDFSSEITSIAQKKARWNEREIRYELPLWMDIKDIDNDGNPEIKLLITPNRLALYIEIANDRLQVDFNPDLYKPLFEKEKTRKRKMKYYVYGFLSGQLGLEEIKAALKRDRDLYKKVVPFLEKQGEWNNAFHEYNDEKPVLKKYTIKRR